MKIKKILYIDANNIYVMPMSEPPHYDENNIDRNVELEDFLNTPDDNDIGYFAEVDLKYLDEIKENQKNSPSFPENKIILHDKLSKDMKDIKPVYYTQNKNLICDWTDKWNYLMHY